MPILLRRVDPALLFTSSDVSFVFFTVSSVAALYRARGQLWATVFVVSAYLNLLALFSCLRRLERAPLGDLQLRRQLKLAVLVLATTLDATFCYQVSKWMPQTVAVVLWFLAALVPAGGLLLFYHGDGARPGNRTNGAG